MVKKLQSSAVEAYLEEHKDEALHLLERLCRQRSVAAQNDGVAEMANLVESLLQENGFSTQRLTVEDAPPVIFGEIRGRSPFTVLLYNHYDVQPAEPLNLWDTPPFEPTIRDGKLYARGSADNKAEIAARLTAIRALREVHGELPVTIRWMIEGEEEIGSVHFEEIAKKYAHLFEADGAMWEGSGFDEDGRPSLVLGCKGLVYVQLDVQGVGVDAHSGSAPILPSAAWRLVQALATLKDADGRVRIPGFYDAVMIPGEPEIEALAQQGDNETLMKQAYGIDAFNDNLTGIELRKRQAFSPTCNIAGLLSGYTGEGSKTVLPAKAMAKIDFRLVPEQEPDDIVAKLRAHLDANGYQDIRIMTFGNAEPVMTPLDHPFSQRIARIAEEYAEKPASITPLGGGTLPLLGSMRRHANLLGLMAPGNATYWGNAAHSPNEHIRIADLEQAVHYNCYMFAALAEEE
ncbi:M20/M25/M40 family metallo-hydrolase [Ktedonospora formicarum]|uniref:Peptidase M20 n=1 Tax=Ktedonospora formicarum TaxID=2778364 RepID=A0A8J3MS81_9CHLR|nr:M20/M25/M40 family metallo-hydrolase [Ktedonospora formicarum]GHO44591.1 peptidase M20 [Ktedonospora formicarum]